MREDLLKRHDIPEEDLDDVLAIAHRLQDGARRAPRTMDRSDVEAVASELSIAPEFVDRAVEELRRLREDRKAAERARRAARERFLKTAVALAAGVLLLLGAVGAAGAIGVGAAATRARAAEAALNVVIDRQMALLPQLVALSGGDPGSLREYEARLKGADTVGERLEAARELGNAMASRVGKLPSSDRQAIQYEIVGAQNRITVEQRRYQEALDAWQSAAQSPQGRLAVSLGWAKAPPRE